MVIGAELRDSCLFNLKSLGSSKFYGQGNRVGRRLRDRLLWNAHESGKGRIAERKITKINTLLKRSNRFIFYVQI